MATGHEDEMVRRLPVHAPALPCLPGDGMSPRWNRRAYLINGLRQRIANESFGRQLISLYSMLFDAVELPC